MNITTYEAAINAIQHMLDEHNKNLPKEVPAVKVQEVITAMKGGGGTTLESLRACDKDDFESFGFPRMVAKRISLLFVSTAPTAAASPPAMVVQTARDALRTESVESLLSRLDPNNPGIVGDELRSRADDRAFIVFEDLEGTKVDVKASTDYINALIRGDLPPDTVMVRGEPTYPLKVGAKPEVRRRENFLYPGRALRQPGNVCDVTNESFDGIARDVEVLLAVAVRQGELRISDPEIARGIINGSKQEGALALFKSRYPRSAAAVRRMAPNELPSLLLAGGGARPPFGDAPTTTASSAPGASGVELRDLVNALISAYPTPSKLNMMLADGLNVRLSHIAGPGNLLNQTFEVVNHFEAKGQLNDLIDAASRSNPGNPALRAFVQRRQPTAPVAAVSDRELLDAVAYTRLSREALMSGIAPEVVGMIQTCPSPRSQTLVDITYLRNTRHWAVWLDNAVALTQADPLGDVFRRARSALTQ